MMDRFEAIVEGILERLAAKSRARETALALCRETIRTAANAIRAIHRHEFDVADEMSASAGRAVARAAAALHDYPDILHAGFVHDAQKEYVEARIVLALVQGQSPPSPDDLGAEDTAYLHGAAESVGELRRHLLDYLRRGEVERCEHLLACMDDIYVHLVSVDFPDAMTAGLRRATDSVRGILEKTRGDLTLAIRQRELEARLDAFERQRGA